MPVDASARKKRAVSDASSTDAPPGRIKTKARRRAAEADEALSSSSEEAKRPRAKTRTAPASDDDDDDVAGLSGEETGQKSRLRIASPALKPAKGDGKPHNKKRKQAAQPAPAATAQAAGRDDEDDKRKKRAKAMSEDHSTFLYVSALVGKQASVRAFTAFLEHVVVRAKGPRRFGLAELENDEDVRAALAQDALSIEELINDATAVHAIALLRDAKDDKSVTQFRVKKPDEVRQAKSLGMDANTMLNIVREAGRDGIWQGDLKKDCKMETRHFEKALKLLEADKKLIKRFKSILRGKKILFILSELEPAREHTGRPWYTESKTFNYPFVEAISHIVLKILERSQYDRDAQGALVPLTVDHIHGRLIATEDALISELLATDVLQVLEHLRSAGKVMRASEAAGVTTEYALCDDVGLFSGIATRLPCFSCEFEAQCATRGAAKYSPHACDYLVEFGVPNF